MIFQSLTPLAKNVCIVYEIIAKKQLLINKFITVSVVVYIEKHYK